MAIPYARQTFPSRRPDGGATLMVSYLTRAMAVDPVSRRELDFRRLGADLQHVAVTLPEGASEEMRDPVRMARHYDEVETSRMRKMEGRLRPPQLGSHTVAALPPDEELTLDEAIELSNRLAEEIRGDMAVAVVQVIHSPGGRRRHAHIYSTARTLGSFGFSKNKVRNPHARPRHGSGGSYIAEAVNWPRRYAQLQTTLFEELGVDVCVDPPMPFGGFHWTSTVYRNDDERVERFRRLRELQNHEIVFGSPEILVDCMRRERSTFPVTELGFVLKKVIRDPRQREKRRLEILEHPAVVSLAANAEDRRLRITTRAQMEWTRRAVTLIDDQCGGRSPVHGGLVVAANSGNKPQEIVDALAAAVRSRVPANVLVVGSVRSDTGPGAQAMPDLTPKSTTVRGLLEAFSGHPAKVSRRGPIHLPPGGLLVIPRSENVDDEDLAKLVVMADERKTRLLLGYDIGRRRGIIAYGLAAYAADELSVPALGLTGFALAEELLRGGLVRQGIAALARRGSLRFSVPPDQATVRQPALVVHNNPERLRDGCRPAHAIEGPYLEHRGDILQPGGWLAFEATRYETRPPIIRAGHIAEIIGILPAGERVLVKLDDGSLFELDLEQNPQVRAASAISIREARGAPSHVAMQIALTRRRHSWAAALLGAMRGNQATVWIDPAVASTLSELVDAVRASLPAALPAHLVERLDPGVEVAVALARGGGRPAPSDVVVALEDFPEFRVSGGEGGDVAAALSRSANREPSPSAVSASMGPPGVVVEDDENLNGGIADDCPRGLQEGVWDVLISSRSGPAVYGRLQTALAPEQTDREEIADRLIELAGARSFMTALVCATVGRDIRQEPNPIAEIPEIEDDIAMCDNLDPWSVYQFRVDIETMKLRCSLWQSAFQPPDIVPAAAP